MRISGLGLWCVFACVFASPGRADMSSMSLHEQAKATAFGCNLQSTKTSVIPAPWRKSNNQIDPDLEGTSVGYWRGPCLTWHTTGLQPMGNNVRIGLATLASETKLPAGKWRLIGRYATDGGPERKVALSAYRGAMLDANLVKSIPLKKSGKIDQRLTLAAAGPVVLRLRSECRNFVCWGNLSGLKFARAK